MGKKKAATEKKADGNGANLGFEAKLWLAADKFRNNMDADAEGSRVDASQHRRRTLSGWDARCVCATISSNKGNTIQGTRE